MIVFNYGTMNSAKSVNLICKAYELKQKKLKFKCMYPNIDTRTTSGYITSRAGLKIQAVGIDGSDDLQNKLDNLVKDGCEYILIDEVQFLDEGCINILLNRSEKHNLNILCYGLLTDFQTKLFPASKRLVEISDTLHHIESYCVCGNIATVNARIDKDGNIVTKGSQIEVGAEDKYTTLCKRCFIEKATSSECKHQNR